MLIAFGQPRAVWSPRWLTVALPLVLCFALAISIFIRVRAGGTLRKRTEFINLVDAATHSIESSLQDFTVIIVAMKGLFLATGEVGCAEAKTFTDILLEHKRNHPQGTGQRESCGSPAYYAGAGTGQQIKCVDGCAALPAGRRH